MRDHWAEQYVDGQVEQAWRAFRLRLADRFAEAMDGDGMRQQEVVTPTGERFFVSIDPDFVIVGLRTATGAEAICGSESADRAAYALQQELRERFHVVHPAFLGGELVRGIVPDAPTLEPKVAAMPRTGGVATSREQLAEWMLATFNEGRDEPLRPAKDGGVWWRTKEGKLYVVRARNSGRIELRTAVTGYVDLAAARRVIEELSPAWLGLKFFVTNDVFVISQILVASPFYAEQLRRVQRSYARHVDELAWVAEKVRRQPDDPAPSSVESQLADARAEVERLRQVIASTLGEDTLFSS